MEWKEINRRTNENGEEQVIYAVGAYTVLVSDDKLSPGGKDFGIMETYGSYYPAVFVRAGFRDVKQTIKIQTTSYGALKPEDINAVITGYMMAQELAKDIQSRYPECF